MKNIVVIFSIFMASCASNSKFPVTGGTFFVKELTVALDQKCNDHDMPDASELGNIFKSQV